jgi:uncharacterized protein YbbC (DUF1343 family)
MVKIGLEVLLESRLEILAGQRVGLVVHPPSVDRELRHAADLLHARPEVELTALFGPQHGIRGETQDNMIEWEGFTDARSGVPVYSLYGETRVPYPEMLRDVDTLVIDLADVGTRIYTFIYTMAHCMQAAARDGKRVVVLDRPNPIDGVTIDGNMLEPDYASFVGLFPMPTRHGMTCGELARFFNDEFGIDCDLEVVPMEGWRRDMWFDETGQPWVFPSPNMPTLETAAVFLPVWCTWKARRSPRPAVRRSPSSSSGPHGWTRTRSSTGSRRRTFRAARFAPATSSRPSTSTRAGCAAACRFT